MADSSFDPLALVKAMGPQRDATSWAEMYYQDASKGQQLRDEMKNRLLAQENQQKFQAGEHTKDRSSRMGIVEYQQREMNKRAAANAAVRQQAMKDRQKDVDWPPGSISEQEATTRGILRGDKFDESKYKLRTRHGITKLIPADKEVAPSRYPELAPATAPAATRDAYDDGF